MMKGGEIYFLLSLIIEFDPYLDEIILEHIVQVA